MRQASYALAALLAPFVAWYLLAPATVLFGWSRRRFMRFCSWMLILCAVVSIVGDVNRSPALRLAWGASWLGAAVIGFGLCGGVLGDSRARRLLVRTRQRRATVAGGESMCASNELIVLCERWIGAPVAAAAHVRVKSRTGGRTYLLALSAGYLWWIELPRWQLWPGRVLLYRPLAGLATHSERRRRGRHRLELSWPSTSELFTGVLYGPGADRLAGQLAAEQFARTRVDMAAPAEER